METTEKKRPYLRGTPIPIRPPKLPLRARYLAALDALHASGIPDDEVISISACTIDRVTRIHIDHLATLKAAFPGRVATRDIHDEGAVRYSLIVDEVEFFCLDDEVATSEVVL